jgi:hypothetical protein
VDGRAADQLAGADLGRRYDLDRGPSPAPTAASRHPSPRGRPGRVHLATATADRTGLASSRSSARRDLGPAPPAIQRRSTWSADYPVPLSDLRYVTSASAASTGGRNTGELIAHRTVARGVVAVFGRLFAAGFPVEQNAGDRPQRRCLPLKIPVDAVLVSARAELPTRDRRRRRVPRPGRGLRLGRQHLGRFRFESCGPGSGAASGTVTVFAAASLTESFTTLGKQFEAAHPGTTVKFNFGASSSLAENINQGAPADVFASASPKNMQQVVDAGGASDSKTFANNVMQIAVPPDNPADVTQVTDLAKSSVKVALCQPQVPCGTVASRCSRRPTSP